MVLRNSSSLNVVPFFRSGKSFVYRKTALAASVAAAALSLSGLPAQAQPVCTGNCNVIDGDVLEVGSFGNGSGSFTLQNGDTLNVPNGAALGFITPGPGSDFADVLVTGAGTNLTAGAGVYNIRLGSGTNANMTISDGALVRSTGALNNGARVFIGGGGSGILNITVGGTLEVIDTTASPTNSAGIDLGNDNGDYAREAGGTMIVDGVGSSVSATGDQAFFIVGGGTDFFGNGSLIVRNGAEVAVTSSGTGTDGSATINLGTGRGSGNIRIEGAGSTVTVDGGSGFSGVIVGQDFPADAGTIQRSTLAVVDSALLDIKSTNGTAQLVIGNGRSDSVVTARAGGVIRVEGNITLTANSSGAPNPETFALLIVNDTGVVEANNVLIGRNPSEGVEALLYGTGLVRVSGTAVLNDTGIISPGEDFGEIGTLRIEGDFLSSGRSIVDGVEVDSPGGVLEIDALEDGTSDRLSITGVATLNGGNVRSLSPDGEWSVARQYTILSADGGVEGAFDGVSTNLDYLVPTLSYTANTVQLNLARLGAPVQEDILEESNAQQVSVTSRVVSTVIQSQVSSTVAAAFGTAASPTATAYVPGSITTGLSAGDDASSGNVWMNLTPSKYESDSILPGSDRAQTIDGSGWNFLLGLDQLVAQRFVVGVYAGAEGSDIDIDEINGKQEADGLMLGGYAGVALNEHFYISANANYAWMENSIEEQAFGSLTPVKGEYDSNRYSIGADLNWVKVINNFDLRGQIGYNYTREKYDSYTTSLGDRAQIDDQKLGRARLALTTSYIGETYRPYLSVAYENDVETSIDTNDDDGWVIYGGLRTEAFREGLTLEAFLSAVVDRDNQDHNMLGLNIHYTW